MPRYRRQARREIPSFFILDWSLVRFMPRRAAAPEGSQSPQGLPAAPAGIDGVTLLDTGDFYGNGHNEMLIGRALKDRRDKAMLSVKFGALRTPDGGWTGVDARPAAVKNFAAYSLTRLGVDHIDIYRPARLDPIQGKENEEQKVRACFYQEALQIFGEE